MIEAGYFINTDKSQHVPSTVVCFLVFLCDSMRQALLIPQDKKTKFATSGVQGRLRFDVAYWRFLDDWSDCLPWRSEQHCIVSLFCDASKRSWGGVLFKDGRRIESSDYWMDASDDIKSLEVKALVRSLLAFRDHVRNSRVDIHTDNRTLKAALDNFGCKNSSVNDSVKEIFSLFLIILLGLLRPLRGLTPLRSPSHWNITFTLFRLLFYSVRY